MPQISNGALDYPRSINIHVAKIPYILLCSLGVWGPVSPSFGDLCAVKCLKLVLAVTQHVGNWRRWVKEGEEFIKPRTTSQFLLIYHINPHLSPSVLTLTQAATHSLIRVAQRRKTHDDLLAKFSASLTVLQYRQTATAAVAGLT